MNYFGAVLKELVKVHFGSLQDCLRDVSKTELDYLKGVTNWWLWQREILRALGIFRYDTSRVEHWQSKNGGDR